MRVTQTRPRFNVPSERREHHQPQVIGRLIREKISLPPPGLEPGSPALESSVLTTPPLARSSIFLELERAVMHVSEEEEENGAVGDAVCSSHTTPVEKNDAVSVHLSRVEQCRDQARLGQEKSRAEMLRTTRQKLQPLLEGEAVLIPISEFDRGRLDCRNVPGVVLEAKNDLYKIGTEHGLLSSRLSRNQIIKADFQIISRQNVKTDITLPFRRIAALHSRFGGQGFTKCSCKGLCSTKRCQCLKSKTKCHSHCHPHKTCTNK